MYSLWRQSILINPEKSLFRKQSRDTAYKVLMESQSSIFCSLIQTYPKVKGKLCKDFTYIYTHTHTHTQTQL